MANQGAKKRLEQNRQKIRLLRQIILVANAIFVVGRLGIFYSSSSKRHYLLLFIISSVYVVCHRLLLNAAEPVYQAGELEDGGSDLELRGSIPYYAVEVIYVTALLQVLSVLITDKVWWLLLALPAYGLFLLWQYILQPWIFAKEPEDTNETEAMRKKREKLERKQNKVKYSKGRR